MHEKKENFSSTRRAVFFLFAWGEYLLRISKEPKGGSKFHDFLLVIFWPQRLIDQYPDEKKGMRGLIRFGNGLIFTILFMFVIGPYLILPLAAMLAGFFGATVGFGFLPMVFSVLTPIGISAMQVFFGLIGIVYSAAYQRFNVGDPDGQIKIYDHHDGQNPFGTTSEPSLMGASQKAQDLSLSDSISTKGQSVLASVKEETSKPAESKNVPVQHDGSEANYVGRMVERYVAALKKIKLFPEDQKVLFKLLADLIQKREEGITYSEIKAILVPCEKHFKNADEKLWVLKDWLSLSMKEIDAIQKDEERVWAPGRCSLLEVEPLTNLWKEAMAEVEESKASKPSVEGPKIQTHSKGGVVGAALPYQRSSVEHAKEAALAISTHSTSSAQSEMTVRM